MKKITANEFSDFYCENIYPIINNFENERKKLKSKILLIAIISVLPAIFFLIISGIIGLIIIVLIVCSIAKIMITNYREMLKEYLYKDIFKQLDLNYSNLKNEKQAETLMHNVCEKSQIFNRHDCIYIDDTISGIYADLPVKIYDAEVYYRKGSVNIGTTRRIIPFLGIFLATKINKNLACEILIKSKGKFSGLFIGSAHTIIHSDETADTQNVAAVFSNRQKQQVKFENVEFEKTFEVYSDDQIECHELLTPAFIDGLLEYQNKKDYKIELFFSNQITTRENLFLFIHTNKNNFELPVFKEIDKDVFYNVIEKIFEALELIDYLKLK